MTPEEIIKAYRETSIIFLKEEHKNLFMFAKYLYKDKSNDEIFDIVEQYLITRKQ